MPVVSASMLISPSLYTIAGVVLVFTCLPLVNFKLNKNLLNMIVFNSSVSPNISCNILLVIFITWALNSFPSNCLSLKSNGWTVFPSISRFPSSDEIVTSILSDKSTRNCVNICIR